MKIFFYGIGKYEEPFLTQWSQEKQISVGHTKEEISKKNISLCQGAEAVCFFPSKEMLADEEWFYHKLHLNGVKYLSFKSAGIDHLNFKLLKKYNFTAANVPGYDPTAVGYFAVMAILMLLRQLTCYLNKPTRTARKQYLGQDISQIVVGIIGTGSIGTTVATAILKLGGHVIADRHHVNPQLAGKVEYVAFSELLERADVISLHIPLRPENQYLLGTAEFKKMKSGVCIVNTARGKLIDTKAMIKAFKAGKLGGAAIDTLEDEEKYLPNNWFKNPYYQELSQFENVFLTPHIAFFTAGAVSQITKRSLNNARDMIEKRTNANIIAAF